MKQRYRKRRLAVCNPTHHTVVGFSSQAEADAVAHRSLPTPVEGSGECVIGRDAGEWSERLKAPQLLDLEPRFVPIIKRPGIDLTGS